VILAKLFFSFSKLDKTTIVDNALAIFEKTAKLLPIEKDLKKELIVSDQLVHQVLALDGKERRYLILLQNNMELRPGGGFLGQYAILTIKNGKITQSFFEDANILDQRIKAKIPAPYPFKKMMHTKRWKFRDSNFSPDFPTNVEQAKYFYRLSGRNDNFDGVVAVNATVLQDILAIVGPIVLNGIEYNNQTAVLKLEETVEKKYLINDNLDTQNRKDIMRRMMKEILGRLNNLNDISQVIKMVLNQLRNKDIMLWMNDNNMQNEITAVHWDGAVAKTWGGDYLMLVDANLGALKSDYFIKREIVYRVDLTTDKPLAMVEYNYTHRATYGDWRTSDYHSYLRVYVPQGTKLLERKMVSYPNVQNDLGKTYFGFIVHVLMGQQTKAIIKYQLPERVKNGYKLLIEKQSGVGEVPVTVIVKTKDKEYQKKMILKNELKFVLK